MAHQRRVKFTIRTLFIVTFIVALMIAYVQTRSKYVLRVPQSNLFYGLLERGDKIAIMANDGVEWHSLRTSVLIESRTKTDKYNSLTISVTPTEWRAIWWADFTNRLGICLRGDYDNPEPL